MSHLRSREDREDLSIATFLRGTDGKYFEGMQASKEEDKALIRREILLVFKSEADFDRDMLVYFANAL